MAEPEYITVGEAMRRLGTSKNTIARLIREGRLRVFGDPLDRRRKMVEAAEVEKLRGPTRLEPEGKVAA